MTSPLKREPKFRQWVPSPRRHRRTNRLLPPIRTLKTSRRSPRLHPEYPERTVQEQWLGVNQKENDDDRTKLRNNTGSGGNAEKISAYRCVRRTGRSRGDMLIFFQRFRQSRC